MQTGLHMQTGLRLCYLLASKSGFLGTRPIRYKVKVLKDKMVRQTEQNKIRLLQKKQSALSLGCLSRPFWLATSVQNFRTSAIATITHVVK